MSRARQDSCRRPAFAQETPEAAREQWRVVADHFRPKVPKLASLLDEAEHEVLVQVITSLATYDAGNAVMEIEGGRRMRVAPTITLTEEQRATLSAIARARSAQPARLVQRAKVILFAASGLQNKEIAQRIGASRFLVAPLARTLSRTWHCRN